MVGEGEDDHSLTTPFPMLNRFEIKEGIWRALCPSCLGTKSWNVQFQKLTTGTTMSNRF